MHFTGFVLDDQCHGLLKGSDLIAMLTTRDHTMQGGPYEAIYLGRPVLTSDWPILRDNFFQGAVFVDSSIQGIADGLRKALADLLGLKKEALTLRSWKRNNWKKTNRISYLLLQRMSNPVQGEGTCRIPISHYV